jgi:hypothetical protein
VGDAGQGALDGRCVQDDGGLGHKKSEPARAGEFAGLAIALMRGLGGLAGSP